MRLILMRHARAGEPDPRIYPNDDLRPLDAQGRREHEVVASLLARMDLGISHVLSSPLARAAETAEITARTLGTGQEVRKIESLGHQFTTERLCRALREYPAGEVIILVGHEPDLSHFAAAMLAVHGDVSLELKKSATLGLEFEGYPERGTGTLLFLISPSWILRRQAPAHGRNGGTAKGRHGSRAQEH